MAEEFSNQTIRHLAGLITGDPWTEWDGPPPYRTGPEITRWMQQFVSEFELSGMSRFSATQAHLDKLNKTLLGRVTLQRMIAAALDPRDFAHVSALLDDLVAEFNMLLWYDHYRLVREPRTLRLERIVDVPIPARALSDTLETLDWETVERDFQRMLENCQADPEDAITSACALVEAVCRSILVDTKSPIPKKRTVTILYGAVAEKLGIAAARTDFPDDVVEESRRILGSLANAVSGIGELRTKVGDAHGREHTVRRVDPRIARLAIGSAATLTLFLIETWQQNKTSQTEGTCAATPPATVE